MADVEDCGNSFSDWSWVENKQFETGLALIGEENPDRWKEIASMIGGNKSEEEVKKHYEALLMDLVIIESGCLDHEYSEDVEDNTQPVNWNDDDQKKFLTQLSIKDRHPGECSSDDQIFLPTCSKNIRGPCPR